MKYAPFGNYLRRDVSMVSKHVLTRGLFGSPTNPEPPPTNVYVEACPSRAILELIADKWTLLILPALRDGRMRNSDLMRLIGGVSQKMLTQTLRELERNGIVNRIDHHEVPPRVEYELSPLGRSLSDLVRSLGSWAEEHLEQVIAARDAFEAHEKQKP